MISMFTWFRPDLKEKARINRSSMLRAEKVIWYELLSKKQMGYRFLRQKPIITYIVDFYCSKLKLIIEIDGDTHLDQGFYDEKRTEAIEKLGFRVIRYSNNEVLEDLDFVKKDLKQKLLTRNKELNLS